MRNGISKRNGSVGEKFEIFEKFTVSILQSLLFSEIRTYGIKYRDRRRGEIKSAKNSQRMALVKRHTMMK